MATISRNKSLMSLHGSLHQVFHDHNINNNVPRATLLPGREDRNDCQPAIISPTNSSTDFYEVQQQQEQERLPSPRPLKKRKFNPPAVVATQGPATAAVSIAMAKAEEESQRKETAILKRKSLAAKLRANGVSQKLVLKPSDFARSVFCKNRNVSKTPIEFPHCPNPTETDVQIHAKHSQFLYDFVRKGTDLEGFKKCVRELQQAYHGTQTENEHTQTSNQPKPFRCSNRFGESLMHLACRRGRTEMVRFMVEELPGGSQMLSITDDCNKTPLHDACWTPSPNFELVELILEHAPEQLLMKDIRGNTPFDYVRKDDYSLWLRFLWDRRSNLGSGRSFGPQIPTN